MVACFLRLCLLLLFYVFICLLGSLVLLRVFVAGFVLWFVFYVLAVLGFVLLWLFVFIMFIWLLVVRF